MRVLVAAAMLVDAVALIALSATLAVIGVPRDVYLLVVGGLYLALALSLIALRLQSRAGRDVRRLEGKVRQLEEAQRRAMLKKRLDGLPRSDG